MTNLDIVKAYQDAIWLQKDISAIDKFFDETAIVHSPVEATKGTEKMKAVILQWHKAFPGLKVVWDDFICDDDKVVSRWHAQGLHEGEFLGNPPSKSLVKYAGVTIYQLSNQKIIQYWAFVDLYNLLKSIKI
ncbi:MAG: ester cyclase [Legionella sp.]|nr:ester cyclase [Legionella sp.]